MMELGSWDAEGIHVRDFRGSDISNNYLSTLNDSDYMRFSRQAAITHTATSALEYLRNINETGGVMLAGISLPEQLLVATMTVRPLQSECTVELGLMTIRGFQRRGYGLRMWLACLERLRDVEGVKHIRAGTQAQNGAMRRILELSGFHLDEIGHPIRPHQEEEIVRYYLDMSGETRNAAD